MQGEGAAFKEPITPRLSGDRHNDRPNDSRIDRLNKSVKATFLVIERNPGLQRKRIAELPRSFLHERGNNDYYAVVII